MTENDEYGFPKYMGMEELLEKLKNRKQTGGVRGTRTLRQSTVAQTPRVKSLFDEMVSKGYSRKYLTKQFSKLRDIDLEQYYGEEEYFIKDAAMHFFEKNSNIKPSVEQFIQAGFSEEAAQKGFKAIELMIDNSSYTYDQLYEMVVDYLVTNKYSAIESSKKNFFYHPDIIGQEIPYNNSRLFNIPYKFINKEQSKQTIYNYLSNILNKYNKNNTTFYFHTTNWDGCKNVIRGVKHGEGRRCLDFGYLESFYLSPHLELAINWGFGKNYFFNNEVAIVIFAVSKFPKNLKLMNYKSATKDWANNVFLSRLCDLDNYNELDDYDFVQGPLLANPQKVKENKEEPIPIRNKIQLASKTFESDQFLDTCLLGAFVFSKNNLSGQV
jgi:hypothetical protein